MARIRRKYIDRTPRGKEVFDFAGRIFLARSFVRVCPRCAADPDCASATDRPTGPVDVRRESSSPAMTGSTLIARKSPGE
jgi:hypothetical protein